MMQTSTNSVAATRLLRGPLLHCLAEPDKQDQAIEYLADALLHIENGHIAAYGDYQTLAQGYATEQLQCVEDHADKLMVPGFIDCHVHYPQTEMIAAYGTQLLDWLSTYTFPVESQFGDLQKSRQVAEVFLQELLRNGTTTALVFCTVHPESVDGFFQVAQARNLRMIAGKVLMDRHAPPELLDTPATGYQQSQQLINQWHGVDRLQYAVTPRFAPTSSAEQLRLAGQLVAENPGVYMHTHLSENHDEVVWVKQLFPEADSYLDVYDQAGLLGPRSIFAHGIHLCDSQCQRLADSGSAIAHCPTSNLFIGSGLFPLRQLQQFDINIGMGTDVGGGSSFSMLQTLSEAYKIQQLQQVNLSPEQAFYMATLGGAKALDLDDKIGNFALGKEADFLLLDMQATPLLKFRTQYCQDWRETLFVLQTLGDDRVVVQTNILGQPSH
ncbi:MAG: guanine deaminase [Gammaproteobacteria bacterium]|jgi:guanine deaminase|nr:guanine deaminase [Gammaproteobacteria bacterium]